jgi:hypothetical protein
MARSRAWLLENGMARSRAWLLENGMARSRALGANVGA